MEKELLNILNRAIKHYGTDMQKKVAIEEMSELTKELVKDMRGEPDKFSIAEEIADVENMLEQLKIIYKVGYLVEGLRVGKIVRLENRMNEDKK